MRIKPIIMLLACICAMLMTANFAEAKDWRGIVVLHSTRTDVERLLGPPTQSEGEVYNLRNETVLVEYSSGKCGRDPSATWNVPSNTVISIVVYPTDEKLFSTLNTNLKEYQKAENKDHPEVVYYSNDEEGIIFEVSKDGILISTRYRPSQKDEYLRCPRSSKAQSKKMDGYRCPIINIDCLACINKSGVSATLNSDILTAIPNLHPLFRWTVSSGRIISGQGTSRITIDTTSLRTQAVKVILEVSGLPTGCPQIVSCMLKLDNSSQIP